MSNIDSTPLSDVQKASTEQNDIVNILDRAREAVRAGTRSPKYSPIEIIGEPLSATILRDRGPALPLR